MLFYEILDLAWFWKNLVFLSPDLSHKLLDLRHQYSSSFITLRWIWVWICISSCNMDWVGSLNSICSWRVEIWDWRVDIEEEGELKKSLVQLLRAGFTGINLCSQMYTWVHGIQVLQILAKIGSTSKWLSQRGKKWKSKGPQWGLEWRCKEIGLWSEVKEWRMKDLREREVVRKELWIILEIYLVYYISYYLIICYRFFIM